MPAMVYEHPLADIISVILVHIIQSKICDARKPEAISITENVGFIPN